MSTRSCGRNLPMALSKNDVVGILICLDCNSHPKHPKTIQPSKNMSENAGGSSFCRCWNQHAPWKDLRPTVLTNGGTRDQNRGVGLGFHECRTDVCSFCCCFFDVFPGSIAVLPSYREIALIHHDHGWPTEMIQWVVIHHASHSLLAQKGDHKRMISSDSDIN